MTGELRQKVKPIHIIKYNLLFLAFSLGVITAGASLAALCEGMQRIASGEDPDKNANLSVYFESFRRLFLKGTACLAISVVGYLFLACLLYAASSLSGNKNATMYMASFYVMALLIFFGFQNLYPSLARWPELSVLALLFRIYLVAGAGIGWTFAGVAASSLIGGILLMANRFLFPLGLIGWGVCGFAASAYIGNRCFNKAADLYEKKYEHS